MPQQGTVPIPSDATVGAVPIPAGTTVSPDAGSPRKSNAAPQSGPSLDYDRLSMALTNAQMTGMPPDLAYTNHDQVQEEFNKRGVDLPKTPATIANDIKVGAEGSIFGLSIRHKMPEGLQDPNMFDRFVEGAAQMVADLPIYLAVGAAGAAAGTATGIPVAGTLAGGAAGFGVPAAIREALVESIQKGDIKDFDDLMHRVLNVAAEGAKGAATGVAFEVAGAGTVAMKALGPAARPLAETAAKKLQQAAALELVPAILHEQMPTAEGFGSNAVILGTLGLITHGKPIESSSAKQALMDVYAKDGTTPKQTADKLQAQPPVKPDMKPGLQPAIRLTAKDGSEQVISGEDATHADLAERVTGIRPISIDQLEADPKLADKVLSQPEIQVQQVIDRAQQIKLDEGEPRPEASLKSGRGFMNLNGDYLNRSQAKKWVKENEPEVYEMWKNSQGGNDKAEFHSQDYKDARDRVANRNLAEGEPQLSGVSQQLTQFLAKNRESLNDIKAGDKSDGYGKEVIRTLFTGPRNMVRAQAEQVAGRIEKLIPDYRDQEALSFMRDYRDAPDELRSEIEEIRKGDNEKLKAAIPSMERALQPTPAMLEADRLMTDYFTQANSLRSQFVGVDTSIDPSRYSPRNFMHVEDEEGRGMGGGKFAKRSPHDIRREYLRLLDPLKSGEVQARTFNSVDELRVYGDRLGTSVARNVFDMELKNSELGKHGIAGQVPPELKQMLGDTSIFTQRELEELGGIPKSWVELPGTGKTIVSGDKQFRVGLQVPPKITEAMKPILEHDVISGAKYWKVAKLTQAYIKAIELGLSPFHMRALSLSFLNNSGIDAYREALLSDNNSPAFEAQERQAALYGVTTTKTSSPYEAYRGLKPSSLESRNTLLAKVKETYAPVDALFKGVTKATFEVAQRKFKVIDFSVKQAQWLAKHPDATDAEYGTAMRSIAKEVNAVYGGLNWEVMGVSANFQAVARMFLLAPDWTFSNVATLKYAGTGGPGGSAARAFWIKSFATGYAMTQGMSLFLTGQMSKQPFNVYLGKDDKGKEMYSSIFLAGAPKDAIGLATKTMRDGFPAGAVEFSVNKASPLFGTGARMLLNKDWQGKPIYKPKDTFGEKSSKELAFGAEQLFPAPFVLKDIRDRFMNPDESLTYKDFLAALAGASVYHEGAKQGKKVNVPGTRKAPRFKVKAGQ